MGLGTAWSEPVLIDMEIDGGPCQSTDASESQTATFMCLIEPTENFYMQALTANRTGRRDWMKTVALPCLPGVSTSEEGTIRVCPGVEGGKKLAPLSL